ncbi:MAG TPA: thioesterase family protein [Pyrinomonadaceae bacterium]|nr:thioesterase family protein [Pyrinomonadaceae bacterium]
MKFSHSFRVSAADIDSQNHVNNVAYVRWIQDVAVAHWRHFANEEQQAKFNWFILRHVIDYKKQAFAGEEITATTWVGEPTRISWERFTEIRRGEDLLVKARSVWCLIDHETAKPTRITSELKELFD